MNQAKLSARKRFFKPLLFGAIMAGLTAAYVNRHIFFPDVEEIRAKEYARYKEKEQEVLERRVKQLAELAAKKPTT